VTVVVVALVLLLCAALAVAIAWPLLHTVSEELTPAEADAERRAIEDELHQSLSAIKEIAFDRDSGHLSEADFAALDADERARAIELMRRRDRLMQAGGAEPTP
jgi:hypothetical protein